MNKLSVFLSESNQKAIHADMKQTIHCTQPKL